MTTRLRHPISFTIAVRSPFIMAGVDASGVGIDTRALRDEVGRPVLPGDHLKGLLREALLALGLPESPTNQLSITSILGRKSAREREEEGETISQAEDSNLPERGQLRLRDLVAERMLYPRPDDPDQLDPKDRVIADWRNKAERGEQQHEGRPDITRIAIDASTGTVSRGMLQVVELATPLGAVTLFEGEGLFYGTDPERDQIAPLLQHALELIPFFGGLRTAGFGEHHPAYSRVEIGPAEAIVPAVAASAAALKSRYVYEGEFTQAFLVSAARLAENVYEGSAVIPGGAIKGALADMLHWAGKEPMQPTPHGKALSKMRISHARPLHVIRDGDGRARSDTDGNVLFFEAGRALPLSLMRNPRFEAEVMEGNRYAVQFQCAFDSTEPGLMNGVCANFQPDWKSAWLDAARTEAARPRDDLAKLGRGHTRIDRKTGGAEDQGLFVEAARGFTYDDRPAKTGEPRKPNPCRFRFQINCPGIEAYPGDEQIAASEILAMLESGVSSFGKTNTRLSVKRSAEPLPPPIGTAAGRWKILLETDAVLADPDSKDAPGSVELALRTYFANVLPGAALVDWYARRKLIGRYLGMRHRADGKNNPYRPWSLFEAGSCFLVKAEPHQESAVTRRLEELRNTGLPVFRWDSNSLIRFDDWRDCPFLPQNGYGEFSVDDPVFRIEGSTAAEDAA